MYALAFPPPSTLSCHPFHPHNTATKAAPAHSTPSQHWVWQLEVCPEACSGKNQLLSTKPIVGRGQGGSQGRGAQGRCQAKLSRPELCVLSEGSRGRSRQKRSVVFFLHFLHLNMHTVPWAAQQTQARVHIHSSHSHTHTHNMCMHTNTTPLHTQAWFLRQAHPVAHFPASFSLPTHVWAHMSHPRACTSGSIQHSWPLLPPSFSLGHPLRASQAHTPQLTKPREEVLRREEEWGEPRGLTIYTPGRPCPWQGDGGADAALLLCAGVVCACVSSPLPQLGNKAS